VSSEPAGERALIVVPAWNEEQAVGETVREIYSVLPMIDVLVVDDGSSDRTAEVARAAGAKVLELSYNLGVGGAMRAGFRYAVRHGYTAAVQVDADGQHDPNDLPVLLAKLSEADIVIGSRFEEGHDYAVRGPRKWAMAMLSWVFSRMARTKLTDTTSGFRACDRELINLFADWYPVEYLGDTVETLVRTLRLGYRVSQIPVAMRRRTTGTPSQSPLKAMLYLARAFFTLFLALARR